MNNTITWEDFDLRTNYG